MDLQPLIDSLHFSNIAWQIITPLLLSLIDIITGYIQSVINHNTDSSVMRKGLLHKIIIMLIILVSFVLSFTFNIEYISTIVCIYVIVMELTSIVENVKKAGVNLEPLKNLFKKKGGKK